MNGKYYITYIEFDTDIVESRLIGTFEIIPN